MLRLPAREGKRPLRVQPGEDPPATPPRARGQAEGDELFEAMFELRLPAREGKRRFDRLVAVLGFSPSPMQGQATRADGGDESGEASFPRARASQPVSPVPAPIACTGKIECPPEPASASHSFLAAQGWNIEAAGRPLLRQANPGATNFSRAEGNGERSPSAARPHRGLTTRAQRCIIMLSRRYGGIGRHKGLKILRKKFRIGSSPISGTMPDFVAKAGIFVAMACAAKALRPCRKQSPARKRRHTGDRPDMRKTRKATSAQRPVITASPHLGTCFAQRFSSLLEAFQAVLQQSPRKTAVTRATARTCAKPGKRRLRSGRP